MQHIIKGHLASRAQQLKSLAFNLLRNKKELRDLNF